MLRILNRGILGQEIGPDLLGANALVHKHGDGIGFSEDYQMTSVNLGTTNLRYPGGTVTEQFFDVRTPNIPHPDVDQSRFVPLDEAISHCIATGREMTLVVPSAFLLLDEPINTSEARAIDQNSLSDLRDFLASLFAQYGDQLPITAFEVGNEYWATDMSAKEYGVVVNSVVSALTDSFEAANLLPQEFPEVLVQMGNPWSREFDEGGVYSSQELWQDAGLTGNVTENDFLDGEMKWLSKIRVSNEDIITELDQATRDSITGLVQHYYYKSEELILSPSNSGKVQFERTHAVWKDAGFANAQLHFTEWNIFSKNSTETGLRGASTLIEQYSTMIDLGVQSAFVWPPVHSTTNSLASSRNGAIGLTPAGAAFEMLSELPEGGRLLDLAISNFRLDVVGFLSDEQIDLFVSSRTDETLLSKLDLTALAPDLSISNLEKISYDPSSVDGKHFVQGKQQLVPYYQDHDAFAQIEETPITLSEHGELLFELNPFEVMHIEIDVSNQSFVFTPNGSSSHATVNQYREDMDQGLVLFGSEVGEELRGSNATDRLYGGDGDDFLEGGAGQGFFEFFVENIVSPKNESEGDRLVATSISQGMEAKGDQLFGGTGNDVITAGRGYDTLDGGLGDDILEGGSGRDTFIFSGGMDKILDYSPVVDKLVLAPELQAKHEIFDPADLPAFEVQDGKAIYRFSSQDQLIIENYHAALHDQYSMELFW